MSGQDMDLLYGPTAQAEGITSLLLLSSECHVAGYVQQQELLVWCSWALIGTLSAHVGFKKQ